MRHPFESVVTIVVGAGLPISQLAVRRLGWPGAAAVTAVSAVILATDLAKLAGDHSEGSLRRVLRLEAAAAGIATVTGALLLLDPAVPGLPDRGVGRPEMLRRIALGMLFGVLSARLRSQATAAG
jgi:hypothetical protein